MPTLIINSILLGVGLAMDAFSVSLANGLNEPCMPKKKIYGIAGTFAVFQAIMPLIGWLCVHTVLQYFKAFESFIPWIALILLGFIGGKMIYESATCKEGDGCECRKLSFGALIVQGIATSIDALSVGFTISDYDLAKALLCAAIIAVITFVICVSGVIIGKKAGTKLSGKAGYLGGIILIIIGLEIFIKGIIN
ncbi:MAG: manganese efflux pump [Ruminococcaceae bacterium]|nr:manganese efflux pump [Oscillospiraceae bacterium]